MGEKKREKNWASSAFVAEHMKNDGVAADTRGPPLDVASADGPPD